MSIYKVTAIFQEVRGGSFTESNYIEWDSARDALAWPESLILARLAFLSPSVQFRALRSANVGPQGETSQRILNRTGTCRPGFSEEITGSGALFQLRGKDGAHRPWLVRGLPDVAETIDNSGLSVLDPSEIGLVSTFVKLLGENQYGILPRIRPTRGGVLPRDWNDIIEIVSTVEGITTITCRRNVGFAKGDRVAVSGTGIKVLPGLAGIYEVLDAALNAFTISYSTVVLNEPVLPIGRVRRLEQPSVKLFLPLGGARFVRLRTRDTKSPIGPSVGSQYVRSLRHSG